jgi:hypothetical protein
MVITPLFENLPNNPKIDIDIDNLCDFKKNFKKEFTLWLLQ